MSRNEPARGCSVHSESKTHDGTASQSIKLISTCSNAHSLQFHRVAHICIAHAPCKQLPRHLCAVSKRATPARSLLRASPPLARARPRLAPLPPPPSSLRSLCCFARIAFASIRLHVVDLFARARASLSIRAPPSRFVAAGGGRMATAPAGPVPAVRAPAIAGRPLGPRRATPQRCALRGGGLGSEVSARSWQTGTAWLCGENAERARQGREERAPRAFAKKCRERRGEGASGGRGKWGVRDFQRGVSSRSACSSCFPPCSSLCPSPPPSPVVFLSPLRCSLRAAPSLRRFRFGSFLSLLGRFPREREARGFSRGRSGLAPPPPLFPSKAPRARSPVLGSPFPVRNGVRGGLPLLPLLLLLPVAI